MEIGTGSRLNFPIALWLLGAGGVTTIDLNQYLKADLVREDMLYFLRNKNEWVDIFSEFSPKETVVDKLNYLSQKSFDLGDFMRRASFDYRAPCDARRIDILGGVFDLQISYNVFEHIPRDVLNGILYEGRRLLRSGGFMWHAVDFSDHFAHSDMGISAINFLQFSEKEWGFWAANRFMFHNRMRLPEFEVLFAECDLRIIEKEIFTNNKAYEILSHGWLKPDARFAKFSNEQNAVTRGIFLMQC